MFCRLFYSCLAATSSGWAMRSHVASHWLSVVDARVR
jgi:hypothetical protein